MSPVTLAARKPVASENAAMSARCSGNSANSRCASARVRKRMRRVGSFSIRTLGARSSHSQSLTHLRRIARTSSNVRFTLTRACERVCLRTRLPI